MLKKKVFFWVVLATSSVMAESIQDKLRVGVVTEYYNLTASDLENPNIDRSGVVLNGPSLNFELGRSLDFRSFELDVLGIHSLGPDPSPSLYGPNWITQGLGFRCEIMSPMRTEQKSALKPYVGYGYSRHTSSTLVESVPVWVTPKDVFGGEIKKVRLQVNLQTLEIGIKSVHRDFKPIEKEILTRFDRVDFGFGVKVPIQSGYHRSFYFDSDDVIEESGDRVQGMIIRLFLTGRLAPGFVW